MLRRRRLSLPYEDQVPLLARLLDPDPPRLEPPQPDRFVAATRHHRVAGQANAARASGALSLPGEPCVELESAATAAVLRSVLLRRELAEVVPVVEEACEAPPLLLKGAAVADRYYPDPRLRPFVDIDLLVPRDRLPAAMSALDAAGYRTMEEFRPDFGERDGHDVHVAKRIGAHPVDVELQWRIGDDPVGEALDHPRLSLSSERIEIHALPVAVPGRADQLLVSALHLLSDRDKRLIWVQDLRLVAAALDDADWAAAFAAAGDAGLGWVLHRALDYAERHLGYSRPRPTPPGPPPAWGPLRAAEELDIRASTHVGRLATLGWRDRGRYMREVLIRYGSSRPSQPR